MEFSQWFDNLKDWANQNPGKIVGMAAGLLVFLILVIFGPKVLLFFILVGSGYTIGKSIDDDISISNLIKKWLGLKKDDNSSFDE